MCKDDDMAGTVLLRTSHGNSNKPHFRWLEELPLEARQEWLERDTEVNLKV